MGSGLIGWFVFFIVLMFITFIVIWNRLMSTRVSVETQHLEDISQDYIKKQQDAQKKMEEAEILSQQMINQAKEEALTMRKDILQSAQDEKEKIIQQAKQQADDTVEQAEKTRHMLITEIDRRISLEAIKKAAQLLGRSLPRDVCQLLHERCVKAVLDTGFPALQTVDVPSDVDRVIITSAFELTANYKKVLLDMIKKKIPLDLIVTDGVDEDLIAGFVVQIGHLVLDGSLRHTVQGKARELTNQENG